MRVDDLGHEVTATVGLGASRTHAGVGWDGWLGVGVGCDVRTRDVAAISHINMHIILHVCTPISCGLHSHSPTHLQTRGV